MAMSALHRWAARAAVPVYACIGPGWLPRAEALLADPALRRAATPREAALLLMLGPLPDDTAEARDRLHDQLAHPRRTLSFTDSAPDVSDLVAAYADLLENDVAEPDRQPDQPPNEWRGVGPNRQGGKGMMGGVPYGRPMAMTDDDLRDGLTLDAYAMRVGPFASMLPPGLELSLTLQGDVIVKARVCAAPFAQPEEADAPAACAARMLRLMGLPAAAARVIAGRRPIAPGLLRALPPGLGQEQDHDARARLRAWIDAATAGRRDAAAPADAHGGISDLARMLVGLEWHEAVLALASFTPDTLCRAAGASIEAARAEEEAEQQDGGTEHGNMEHGGMVHASMGHGTRSGHTDQGHDMSSHKMPESPQ
ncbi:hypothetical protein [Brevirhabdus sp.]|uniref:hypothetical protein n=1 Tax=Brevirhabdus sp. TaxID=2004514 RepID=UPI0040587E01